MPDYEPTGTQWKALLDRLEQYAQLKEVRRSGWVLRGVSEPESVADHSWGTAQLCLLLAPAGIDAYRAAAMAIVHDLAEVEVGDIPRRVVAHPYAPTAAQKAELEAAAMDRLTAPVPPWSTTRISDLWRDYEQNNGGEAAFVRDMNLIDMCLQAVVYERQGRYGPSEDHNFPNYPRLTEFFETSRPRLRTATGRMLFTALEERYRTLAP